MPKNPWNHKSAAKLLSAYPSVIKYLCFGATEQLRHRLTDYGHCFEDMSIILCIQYVCAVWMMNCAWLTVNLL